MLVLDATTKSITTKLGAVHTTNPVTYVYAYADQVDSTETFTEGGNVAQSNGTTSQEVIPAPAASTQRTVKDIMIFNSDTISHAVTLYYTSSGTDYPFYKETLAAGAWAYPLRDGVFEGSAAAAADMILSEIQTVTGAKTFESGKFILAGSSSGATTVNATAAASGTLTLPAATDTLVGKATTDTMTNKTQTAPVLNSATVGTKIEPTTDDGATLGISTKQFSDLYLANNATIRFGNTEAIITHNQASSQIEIAGGTTKVTGLFEGGFTATGAIIANPSNAYALGSTTYQFSDLFLGEGGVINWDNGDATLTQSGNSVTLAGASLTAAIAPRVVTTTDDATAVIDLDATDRYHLTAIANATTISTTGTLVSGKARLIRLKDAGVAKGLTWDAAFRAVGVTLPTTTVAGKTHYILGVDNTDDSKVDVIAVTVQA